MQFLQIYSANSVVPDLFWHVTLFVLFENIKLLSKEKKGCFSIISKVKNSNYPHKIFSYKAGKLPKFRNYRANATKFQVIILSAQKMKILHTEKNLLSADWKNNLW